MNDQLPHMLIYRYVCIALVCMYVVTLFNLTLLHMYIMHCMLFSYYIHNNTTYEHLILDDRQFAFFIYFIESTYDNTANLKRLKCIQYLCCIYVHDGVVQLLIWHG